MNRIKNYLKNIELPVILFPTAIVLLLFVTFIIFPNQSTNVVSGIRGFLSDKFGIYYLILGLGIFLLTIGIAFSKFGKIKLGKKSDKPKFSNFKWGAMIFTSTLAADILFYSLSEWAMYANEKFITDKDSIQLWSSTYPLFHWGPIAWSFYIVLAVAFGFMIHIRGRKKQRFSEACRPLFGDLVDCVLGKIIDIVCIVALICGTATTFSVTTPLLSQGISRVTGLPSSTGMVIMILALIAVVYTITVLFGIKGISKLASFCVYLFFALLVYVLVCGGQIVYIFETGINGLGNMIQNFIGMATYTDPLRENSFPQNWTLYYWAYWMAWCVATPFFIATISKGRTIKNVIIGGYCCGLSGTYLSFIILGNFGLGQQMHKGSGLADVIYNADSSINYSAILDVFNGLPIPELGIIVLVISMIAFYATTFDTLTLVVSNYSYKKIGEKEEQGKFLRVFWSILFIMFPIALIFSKGTLANLQSVSIIAAFPIGIIIIFVTISFFKDAKLFLKEQGYEDKTISAK